MPLRFLILLLLLSGCATTVTPLSPPVAPEAIPADPVAPPSPAVPGTMPPMVAAPTAPLPNPAPVPPPRWTDPRAGKALLDQVLPRQIPDRAGWSADIFKAFTALKIPYTAEYFCATSAVIEQESLWKADPPVPGLGKMVWKQIEAKANAKHIPMPLVRAALQIKSRNGLSYAKRIDTLRTERQMNALFEEMAAEARAMGLPVSIPNPIRTGGPMQVSVAFAEGHTQAWPYPYAYEGSVRNEVFTRRGGVYFGIAILLHYRAPYRDMRYRFADYNAGRYASRNAAFQAALSRLSGRKLALDGDLLRYEAGRPARTRSETQLALAKLATQLKLSQAEIDRDLRQEKASEFDQSTLYQRLFTLADAKAGKPMPRAVFPQIRLISPKITRKLTTEWFAKRVDGRYRACLARAQ
ncbi:DUF1615 domain-containing protein [Chitinimonas sp. BJYL2]|uniref:DUF1615 domain-containing protein n=1 Tax=Chitinimonas sp. BJYL2 TaxID=2976696 RepID=UPI0022B446E7|nr:DUF1615 domain-containing protein [Chitinimonas sp. BJYL2]